MKSKILLLALTVAALSSCTTAYKTGQTPDDVYYSPTRPQQNNDEDDYVQTDKEDDRQYRNDSYEYSDDAYLRMKVRNRYRWSDFEDPYYYSRRYNYSTYNCCCFGNPWTPSSYWNNHYNPYYQGYIIINPKTSVAYSGPRTFNLNSYNTNAITNKNYSNPKVRTSGSNNNINSNTYTAPRNSNSNKSSNSGNILRDVFKNSNDNNSSSNGGTKTNSSSSGSSSSSSGSSSSGSSGSSAPVRRF